MMEPKLRHNLGTEYQKILNSLLNLIIEIILNLLVFFRFLIHRHKSLRNFIKSSILFLYYLFLLLLLLLITYLLSYFFITLFFRVFLSSTLLLTGANQLSDEGING